MQTASIDIATLQAINLCAGETRYYLNGVYVEIAADSVTYTATNGHVLASRRLTGKIDDPAPTLIGSFIVPSDVIKKLKVGARRTVALTELRTEDGKTFKIDGHLFEMIDGAFPDYRRVVPREPMTGERDGVSFDPQYLVVFDKIGERLGIGRSVVAPNGGSPALVWFPGSNNDVAAVIMPMRSATPPKKILPEWLALTA